MSDLARTRADFPILHQQVNGKPLVYLDNGAPTTGQIWQGNLNAMYILGPSLLAQQTTFMGEVVHQHIDGVDSLTITGGGAGGLVRALHLWLAALCPRRPP